MNFRHEIITDDYTLKQVNVKDKDLKTDMYSLLCEIIDTCLDNELLYNFHKKKK